MKKDVIPPILLEKVATRFKLLSEPIRLQLLNILMGKGELCVTELVEITGQTQANVSKHLNLLAREGILERRKEGLKVFYRIADPSIQQICAVMCERIKDEVEDLQKELQKE